MWLAILGLVAVIYMGFILYSHGMRQNGEPPLRYSWIPILGAALEFSRDGPAYLKRMRAKYGDVFTTMFAGHRTTIIADYRDIPTIWRLKDAFNFTPLANSFGSKAFNLDIATIEKTDEHEIHRQYTKYLMGEGLRDLTDKFWEVLMPIMNRVPAGEWQSSDLLGFVRPALLEASTVAMNGKSVWNNEFEENFNEYDSKFPLFIIGIPHWILKKSKQALDTLNRETYYIISNNFMYPDNAIPTDMTAHDMSPIISDRLKHMYSVGLTPEEAQKQIFAFIWASNANVIPGSFWFLYYVLSNPEAYSAAMSEIDEVLSAAAARKNIPVSEVRLERDDFVAMKKIESMINETLRYKMSIISTRLVQQDCDVSLASGDVRFRKGDRVLMFPPEMHHDPEVYPEPHIWKWDRYYSPPGSPPKKFYKAGKELTQPLLPFGGGVNICPGRFFALNEYKIFVVIVMRYFDLEILPHTTPIRENTGRIGNGVIQPISKVPIRFRRRATV